MPREGIFARVLHGGKISVGDELKLAAKKIPLDAAIITVSDRGFHGLRAEDASGDKCAELLTAAGYKIFSRTTLPDVKEPLVDKLIELTAAVDECLNFVLPELKHGIEILCGSVPISDSSKSAASGCLKWSTKFTTRVPWRA